MDCVDNGPDPVEKQYKQINEEDKAAKATKAEESKSQALGAYPQESRCSYDICEVCWK